METRANYVLIGLFTLAVLAGAFGFSPAELFEGPEGVDCVVPTVEL